MGRCTPAGLFQIIFDDTSGTATIHYPKILQKTEPTGKGKTGVDKGLTEAYVDSKGNFYGKGLSRITNQAVDKRHLRGKARNKLYQVAMKTRNMAIFACNLGKKIWNRREKKKRARATCLVRKATNELYNEYSHLVVEDLSSVIKGRGAKKKQAKRNRRASEWTKGVIQTAIEEISSRRKSTYSSVHAAFTSQVDSRYGVLLGTRKGDRFFTFDGEVVHADSNAAIAIQKRENDPDIHLWMHHNRVRAILIKRTAYFLSLRGLTLNDAIERGWFDREHLKKAGLEVEGYRVISLIV